MRLDEDVFGQLWCIGRPRERQCSKMPLIVVNGNGIAGMDFAACAVQAILPRAKFVRIGRSIAGKLDEVFCHGA